MRSRCYLEYHPMLSNIARCKVPSRVRTWFHDSAGDIDFDQISLSQSESTILHESIIYMYFSTSIQLLVYVVQCCTNEKVYHILWIHSYSWRPISKECPVFAALWTRYFVGNWLLQYKDYHNFVKGSWETLISKNG